MSPILGIIASGANVASTNFESIATLAGTGSSGTISFTSIPSTFQHLQLRYIGKSTQGGSATEYNYTIRFNNDTGSNYAYHALRGQGSAAGASGTASGTSISTTYATISNSATARANMHGVGILDIHDYTSTSKNKTLKGFIGASTNASSSGVDNVNLFSGLWFATPAAINRIDLILGTGSWTTTSSFALYGIKGA